MVKENQYFENHLCLHHQRLLRMGTYVTPESTVSVDHLPWLIAQEHFGLEATRSVFNKYRLDII